ncbi:MAG: PAS domain S-box protein [Bacteroidetes bacterium]|nr:PAS domain S-box protein [Bacteroidota bacterium]
MPKESLQSSEATFSLTYQEVLEQSTLPIALCQYNSESVFLNTAFTDYFCDGWKGNEKLSQRFVSEDNWQQIVDSIQKSGEWDSYAILHNNKGDEIVLKVKASMIQTAGEKLIILYFTETNEARRRIFRQGQLLKASSESTTELISGKNFSQSMERVAMTLGNAVQADRCYIFESIQLPDSDEVYASLVAQWSRFEGIEDEERVGMINYTIFPEFYETLLQDKPYSKTQKTLKDNSRKYLESRKIQSFICLPIFKDGTLWGFMGFDDCDEPREWDEQEIASLRLLTNSLSSVLNNEQLSSELEKKNIQLESAIRGSKDSLWDYDVRKEKIYYSPQFMEMIGFSEDEFEGSIDDLKLFLHPRDYYKIFKGLQYIISTGNAIRDFELRLLHKNKNLIWIRVSARPAFDMSGNTIRISGSSTNITLEKTFEKQIAESKEKYKELVDNLREVVFQLNKKGKIEFLSQGWNLISKIDANKTLGSTLREHLFQPDQFKFDAMLTHLFDNPNTYLNCLVRIPDKNKTLKWAEIYARSIAKKDSPTYVLGTIIDVSQRQITEQKLKESEIRYRLISENISDMVTLQDEKGKFIFVSPSAYNILGLTQDDMLGKTPRQIWNEKALKGTAWERDLFDASTNNRMSYPFYTVKGEQVWLETVRSLVYTENEDRFIIQSTTRDISAFKEAEQNLKTSLDKQKELNELKSNFISMASHEFRTPLTTIRSSIQLLEEYSKETPAEQKQKMDKHFSRTKDQIERVTRLMNDVLILGKFDAGKTPFHAIPHDLVKFCEELIAEHFGSEKDGRTIDMQLIGKSIPVLFDGNLLAHVVINLIANAFKYSRGKANPQLILEFEDREVSMLVRDFGIGIPQEDINRIFQSFYRAKNAIEVPGTGLGLVITKEFVELHKGTIQINSQLNQKTEVIVRLPLN